MAKAAKRRGDDGSGSLAIASTGARCGAPSGRPCAYRIADSVRRRGLLLTILWLAGILG